MTVRGLIFAGGRGSRLGPDHAHQPKALLPVHGSTTLLDLVLAQLREGGIEHVTIAVHHHADQVIDAIGNGGRHGVVVDYVVEREALGTAGALALIADDDDVIVATNCDVVTDLAVGALLDSHFHGRSALTIAARHERVQSAYGVLVTEQDELGVARVRAIVEKPVSTQLVNMGMYVIEPAVRRLVTRGARIDMDELIQTAIDGGLAIGAHVHEGSWMDVASPVELELLRATAA